jgi:predicted nuclease with TOPRIM domain
MSMYFLDDTEDWPEYKIIKNDIYRLEKEYFEFIKELQKAESALKFDTMNAELNAKVYQLRKKLKEIEKRLNESLNMYR